MHHIYRKARERARLSAIVEHLEGMPESTDDTEKRAHAKALAQARRMYAYAEASFQQATSTYSDEELAALGLMRAA